MTQVALAEFHGTPVSIIDHAGKKWLTAEQVGLCLGYNEANARQGIGHLYRRHADEFTAADTCEVNLTSQGQMREMRVFSDTGCNLLSFFSSTPRAKDFRAWAKQVLARHLAGQSVPQPSVPQTGRPAVITRHIERQVFERFVMGLNQPQIGRELQISNSTVSQILHAKYRFSPAAGEPECSPALIAAVSQRHLEIEQMKLIVWQERIAQKYLAHSINQELADALDRVGQHLQQEPLFALLPEGGTL